MKAKNLAFLEILAVYTMIQAIGVLLRSTQIVQWEKQNLGWSYSGMIFFIGIPLLVVWLARRDWREYGVSCANWRTNLDLGLKAYLVRIIPLVLGILGAALLLSDRAEFLQGVYVTVFEIIGLAIMIWLLNRQKPVETGRKNIIVTLLLLLFPILFALALGKLNLVIISTVFWQFIFSGFGEEFVWRGYAQTRLNQAFGRPYNLFGVQFGGGLIIASFFFGLLHAFNTYDPVIGVSTLSWGSALSAFVAGIFFGVLREKTGTLLAPGIAHGLPDAVGEALNKMYLWF